MRRWCGRSDYGQSQDRASGTLACVVKASLSEEWQRVIQIGISGHDHGCCPAVLERAPRSRRQLGTQHPAYPITADEAEEPYPLVAHEGAGDFEIGCLRRLTPLLWQPCLAQN